MKVQIVNNSKHLLPEYAIKLSAGMDLRANIENVVIIQPMQRVMVPTGLSIQLPQGSEAQIRPRSGLAAKYGITVLNSPGTIN
jgi:dUTP pyrophosphatase